MQFKLYTVKASCLLSFQKILLGLLFIIISQFTYATADSIVVEPVRPYVKYFNPSKMDVLTTFKEKYSNSNFFFWSKSLKMGFGFVFKDVAFSHYGGAWFRPLSFTKYKGDLIIGANYSMPNAEIKQYDIQIEHRHEFGLSYGGGVYNSAQVPTLKTINYWGKVSFRKTIKKFSFIVTAQVTPLTNGSKNMADHIRPGFYAAVYHPIFMAAGGYSYAQFRSCIAVMSPKEGAKYRPVFEALYIDNNAGSYTGLQYVLVDFTLGYDGGFLSHAARLGRAMSPTGLEFGNPLGFLSNPVTVANWNRKLNSWEMGRMLNFRLENYRTPVKDKITGSVIGHDFNGYAQFVINPFQFDKKHNALDPFFIGAEYLYIYKYLPTKNLTSQGGILAGYFYNIKAFTLSAGLEYVIKTNQPIINLGMIYLPQ